MQKNEYVIKASIIALILLAAPIVSGAAELLIVEEHNCPYCHQFNEEIAEIYPKTAEGKRAPLVRVWLHEPWPERYSNVKKAKYTPTFILVHEGKEIGRLLGYQGDEFFWFLLGDLLDKLP